MRMRLLQSVAGLLFVAVTCNADTAVEIFLRTHSMEALLSRARQYTKNDAALATLERATRSSLERAAAKGELVESDWDAALNSALPPFAHKAQLPDLKLEELLGRAPLPTSYRCAESNDALAHRLRF